MSPLSSSLALTVFSLLSIQPFVPSHSPSTLVHALPSPLEGFVDSLRSIPTILREPWKRQSDSGNATSPSVNSTGKAVWILQDTYEGKTFFDDWNFYTGPDPTNGLVHFLDQNDALAQGLAYVQDDGKVIMKGDNTTVLPVGTNRSSVRIQSNKTYTGGLFILDLNRAPWGCGVWPAFWTFGAGVTWPQWGEIDILEGVHDNVHNQVTWHTDAGCNLVTSPTGQNNFTGTPVGQTDCDGNINSNAGCGITDWSRVSYGETFDAQGGGMYAMKWDETGIAVWYFYRVSLPQDILDGTPDPTTWVTPSALLSPEGCDPFVYFNNHQIVFDITFCGDWAGNTYATTPGCTGTCPDHLTDPTNFVNASWSINSLKVYRKQDLSGVVSSGASRTILTLRESGLWAVLSAMALWITLP
ncbi:hypothetical protein SCHPADRAFT_992348 [Schizopora paradoxa]|uniref:GH16 domain-containing protein n=1 Tax=Schizopora paradoxa TaxID=27342 RepID=A0A0H2S7N2_9AGAM|nr:hypothetical protein SCHPADRAFT_992348 [Schizopora paradoxa]